MNGDANRALAECLEYLEQGASVADCLLRYPRRRAELAPLLETALALRSVALPPPAPAFRAAARRRLLAQVAARPRAATGGRFSAVWQAFEGTWWAPGRSVARWATAALLLLALLAGGWIMTSAARALPGDAWYPLKHEAEQLSLAVSPGGPGAAGLHLELAARRLAEAESLSERNRAEGMAQALAGYVTHVQAARAILEALAPGTDRQALAQQLYRVLGDQQARLNRLAARAPQAAQPAIAAALAAAGGARAAAQQLLGGERPLPAETPTVQPTATPMPVPAVPATGRPTLMIVATVAPPEPTLRPPAHTMPPPQSTQMPPSWTATPDPTEPPAQPPAATVTGIPMVTDWPTLPPSATPWPTDTETPVPTNTETSVPTSTAWMTPRMSMTPRPTSTGGGGPPHASMTPRGMTATPHRPH